MTEYKCTNCDLYKNAKTNCMGGDGPRNSKILLIGEAPGAEEDAAGKPFVGKAGKILMEVLEELGIKREEILLGNCVRCRPTDGRKNLTPTDSQLEACRPHLMKEIEEVSPELIVLVGGRAIDSVLGLGEGVGITSKTGTIVERDGRRYLLCIHPANLIYNPSKDGYERLRNSLSPVAEVLGKKAVIKKDYILLDTLEKIRNFAEEVKDKEYLAVDIETDSLDYSKCKIIGIGFSWDAGKAAYINLMDDSDDFIFGSSADWSKQAFELVKQILMCDAKKVFHNSSFDAKCLHAKGAEIKNIYSDTYIQAHLIDETQRKKLDILASKYTDLKDHKEDLKEYMQRSGATNYGAVPLKIMTDYCCGDADATLRLHHIFSNKISKLGLDNYYNKFQMPVREVLTGMEERGTKVNVDYADALGIKCKNKLTSIENQIRDMMRNKGYVGYESGYVGYESFNPASSKQVGDYFFNYLREPPIKETEGKGISTDESVLKILQDKYYEAELLLAYRKYSKLWSTYIEPIHSLVDKNNRVHCYFDLGKVVTGRLASREPNLQNIPLRDPIVLGENILQIVPIRNLFIAEEGCHLLCFDFSQVELRVLAHYSKDENMINTFLDGGDIHTLTARKIFGLKEGEKETKTQRSIAKTINFGIPYGISSQGVVRNLKKERVYKDEARKIEFSLTDAQGYIDSFFASYPKVQDFIIKTQNQVLKYGYVRSLFGRYRRFPDLYSLTPAKKNAKLREAVNMPIQGTAADITLLALYRIDKRLQKEGFRARVVLTVHDSIMLEVPSEELIDVKNIVMDEMEKEIAGFVVPLRADCEIGKSWGEALKWDRVENNNIIIKKEEIKEGKKEMVSYIYEL